MRVIARCFREQVSRVYPEGRRRRRLGRRSETCGERRRRPPGSTCLFPPVSDSSTELDQSPQRSRRRHEGARLGGHQSQMTNFPRSFFFFSSGNELHPDQVLPPSCSPPLLLVYFPATRWIGSTFNPRLHFPVQHQAKTRE